MTDSLRDAPAVVVFPPTIPLGAVVLSGFLQWLYPLGLFVRLATPWRLAIGAVLVGSGVTLMASGRRALTSSGTNVHPSRPAVALVERGVYRWTRNPLYVGGCFAMLGAAFLFALDWLPVIFPATVMILHFGIIAPEETYLEHKFGDRYRSYKERVPRYLGLP